MVCLHLLLHVEETGVRERETDKSKAMGRETNEREKINKIVIYSYIIHS